MEATDLSGSMDCVKRMNTWRMLGFIIPSIFDDCKPLDVL